MLVEIVGDELYFQTLTETGKTIDSGSVHRVGKVEPTPNRTAQPVVRDRRRCEEEQDDQGNSPQQR